MSKPLSHVMIDVYLEQIEQAAVRLSPGNVSHEGPTIVALVRSLRRKLDLKRNRAEAGGGER